MHGANRLSGNAITEALVTGRIAGETAAARRGDGRADLSAALGSEWAALHAFWHPRAVSRDEESIDALKAELQQTMWNDAGPLRTGEQLERALAAIRALRRRAADVALAPVDMFALNLQEKVELRSLLDVSEAIVLAALARTETRGAHVRLDFPEPAARAVAYLLARDGEAWRLAERAPVPA